MARWLVTGAAGMLGRDLTALLSTHGEEVTGLNRAGLDITDAAAARVALDAREPDVVVNCAAWTAVDDAESAEETALAINGHGPAHLATACRETGTALVQVSTDYVFDGTASAPYLENHRPAPRTVYGRTKLAGEQAVLSALPGSGYVVRTAWLYGAHGRNFVTTMIARARAGAPVTVVDDQHGQPTWTADVARQIHALVAFDAPAGIYHATSSGHTTWHGLAREVFTLTGADPTLVSPVPTSAYPRPAPRSAYSVLGHDAWAKTGIEPIGDWRDALHRAFPAILRG
jgi:dTDP-4-dehydrorhamnose reductase